MFRSSFLLSVSPSKILSLSLIATLAATTVACSKNNALPGGAEPVGQVEEGGISGGGGGTLPSQPIATWQVREVIQDAKQSLIPLLNMKSLQFARSEVRSKVEHKLFGGSKTILDVLYETNIDVAYTGACKDGSGKEVDGSIYGSTPGAICISAERIAAKLTEERAIPEIVALIAHELSHKLGADEKEATEFQKDVAMSLSSPHLRADARETIQASADASMDLQNKLGNLIRDIENTDQSKLDELLTNFRNAELDFFKATRSYPFSILGLREEHYYDVITERIQVVALYLFADGDAYAAERLRIAFRGKTEVTFSEYSKNMKEIDSDRNVYANEVIKLPTSLFEAKQILKASYNFYSDISQIAGSLRFGTKPPAVRLPDNQQQPFAGFIGAYAVTSTACTGGKPATFVKYEFYNDANGATRLRKFTATGVYDAGELRNGGQTVRGGSAMSVSGGVDWATRKVELGNRWGSRQLIEFSEETLAFKKVGSQFELTESYYERAANYKTDRFDEVNKSCTYSLEKTN
ncbi:MAG: hypothetical protein EOP05_02655 [Proteobacteria bacterium]|nr:MAG: hypothetical protein EOP05_02655 [Pseudomonadota bacterium]